MSLLSALLTQDQVVSPKAIDEAIQRQVINGGDFETNLLEIGAIAEDTLAAYCAAVHGLAVCRRDDVIQADPVALSRLPARVAEHHQVASIRIERSRLIVVMSAPLRASERAEIEAIARMPIEAQCVTSARLAWALWRFYEMPLSARLQRLMTRLQTMAPGRMPEDVMIPLTRARTAGPQPSRSSSMVAAAFDAALLDDEREPTPSPTPSPRPSILDGFGEVDLIEPESKRDSRPSDPSSKRPRVAPEAFLATLGGDPSALRTVVPEGSAPPSGANTVSPPVREPLIPLAFEDLPPSSSVFSAPTRPFPAASPSPKAEPLPYEAPVRGAQAPPPRAMHSMPPPQIEAIDFDAGEMVDIPSPPSTRPLPQVRRSVPPSASPREGVSGPGVDPSISTRPSNPALVRGITLDIAIQRLEAADDRDSVVGVLLEHMHSRFAYVAAFVVQDKDKSSTGYSSRGEGCAAPALSSVVISLTGPESALRSAYEAGAPEVAVIEAGTPEHELRGALKREQVTEALVIPVRVGAKVPLLLWADDGAVAPTALALRQAASFAQRCGEAFARIIASRRRPSGREGTGRPSPVPAIPAMKSTPVRQTLPDRAARLEVLRRALGGTVLPPAPPRSPSPTPVEATLPPAGDECLRLIAAAERVGSWNDRDLATLVASGESGLIETFDRFPGQHRIRRQDVYSKLPTTAEAGPMLRAAVAFRERALPRFITALESVDADTRFAALVCLTEVLHPAAIPALVDRLTDVDYPTRMATIEVLRLYRRFPEFERVGRSLRATLRDVKATPEARRASAHALGELRDTDAVVSLVTALTDADAALAASSHRALVVLTRQDFGVHPAPWLDWWDRAATTHRLEWLIDALMHVEPTIRHEASEELKRLTGQYFGYYFNLPRRERERSQQQFLEWWQAEGQARFSLVPTGR